MRNSYRSRAKYSLFALCLMFTIFYAGASTAVISYQNEVEDERGTTGGVQPRMFISGDMIMQFAMQNMDMVPEQFRGPVMFLMGFMQQNMKNFMSSVRSLSQMVISSLVMMAIRRYFFGDLSIGDRQKANGMADAILNIINFLD